MECAMNTLLRSMMLLMLFISACSVTDKKSDRSDDKHYTKVGFFDIHYCNWPDRKPFNMILFSTSQFNEIESIEIFHPNETKMGELDLNKFRLLKRKNKPTKKVFIKKFNVDATFKNGWYKSVVTLKNGNKIQAYDYVNYTLMGIVNNVLPKNNSEDVVMPELLQWQKPNGAKHYQIFIKDLWQDGKLIYTSKLLNKHEIKLPKGLLQSGGYYSWRVHARDINEDPVLGDFNHGSLSKDFYFTVKD